MPPNLPTERRATPLDLAAPSEDDVRRLRTASEKWRSWQYEPGSPSKDAAFNAYAYHAAMPGVVLALIAHRDRLAAENARLQEFHDRHSLASCTNPICDCIEAQLARLQEENARLAARIARAKNVGHNLDCMFCGFKDRALATDAPQEHADA